eukprot:m.235501 g.235501  ORF g.235501 m.235501 type:complete len:210 (-) comp33664_c12_seq1:97-726(-)
MHERKEITRSTQHHKHVVRHGKMTRKGSACVQFVTEGTMHNHEFACTSSRISSMLKSSSSSSSSGAIQTQDAVPPDHYSVLQLPSDCTQAQILKAYKYQSRKLHPDRPGGSTLAFQKVAEAHEVLSDAKTRIAYDMGDDLPATGREDAPTLLDEVHMRYFPELEQFKPYGDPLQRYYETLEQRQLFEADQRRHNDAREEKRRQMGHQEL